MTNGPAALAPIGGKKAILGTNPLAVSVPSENIGQFRLIWRPVLLQEEK